MSAGTDKLNVWRFVWRLLFAAAVLFTAWASLAPPAALPNIVVWDKLAHAINYALLTLLLLSSQARPRFWITAIGVMLCGIAIEFAQATTAYRHADWHDALANGVGILAAGCIWYVGIRVFRRLTR